MKNTCKAALPILLLVFAATGCHRAEPVITSLSMLEKGKTFAVPAGTAADQMVLDRIPDARIIYFNNVLHCALAVKEGKAHATAYDLPVLSNLQAKIEGLTVLDEFIMDDQYGFAVRKEDNRLKEAMDRVLSKIQEDGTYARMLDRWFPKQGDPGPMPQIPSSGENGILNFGTAAVTEPMTYVYANEGVIGFDIEYAAYIAQDLGMQLNIVDMEFGAMLPALISGKVDMIGAGLSITEERAKSVLFSEPYYKGGLAVMVREKPQQAKQAKRAKTLGVLLGSTHEQYAMTHYPNDRILQFQNVPDLLVSLRQGKSDAAMYVREMLAPVLKDNPDLGILADTIFYEPIGAVFNKENDSLRLQFNAFIQQIRGNGIYDQMVERWVTKQGEQMPEIEKHMENGELRVAMVTSMGLPFIGVSQGSLVGYDVEIMMRFASYLGKKFVPIDMPFNSLLLAVAMGKADMAVSCITITEERAKTVAFSDKYYECSVSIIADMSRMTRDSAEEFMPSETTRSEKKGFFKKISESFHNNLVQEDRYKLVLDGLAVTVIISILAAILGTLLAGVVCSMRMSASRFAATFAKGYISFFRGTPVLVLLMIIFYVVFASVQINPVLVAVIAFGLNFAAYVAEIFRTSINSIGKGQKEAGIAAGFTRTQTMTHIILPQALRHALPVYKGEFISMVKATSVVGYIAVQDVTRVSDIIRSRTFDAFFPLLVATVIYLALSWLLTWLLDKVEISVDPKRKRVRKMKEETV
ncbi:MAG TPA: ABC transporter permease subunit [Bacteroidales bacterium]|mgnify:FL=1|nr:ABC transporter permease subunit [Bacteroidales bacterium]